MITKEYSPVAGDVVPMETPYYFEITNDVQADNAIRAIKEEEQNTERIIAIAEAEKAALDMKIKQLRERCEQRTQEKRDALMRYFESVEKRQTKTTEKYDLLSGTLVRKKPAKVLAVADGDSLTDWLERNAYGYLISTTKKPKWAEIKKLLSYNSDGVVSVTDTGEVVDGVTVEDKPGEFQVKY